jgi:hypothetical protein
MYKRGLKWQNFEEYRGRGKNMVCGLVRYLFRIIIVCIWLMGRYISSLFNWPSLLQTGGGAAAVWAERAGTSSCLLSSPHGEGSRHEDLVRCRGQPDRCGTVPVDKSHVVPSTTHDKLEDMGEKGV